MHSLGSLLQCGTITSQGLGFMRPNVLLASTHTPPPSTCLSPCSWLWFTLHSEGSPCCYPQLASAKIPHSTGCGKNLYPTITASDSSGFRSLPGSSLCTPPTHTHPSFSELMLSLFWSSSFQAPGEAWRRNTERGVNPSQRRVRKRLHTTHALLQTGPVGETADLNI